MIKEACIENATLLSKYIDAGANRIELCDNLAVGGTTASFATIDYAKAVCKYRSVELGVIIRARGGNFVYNDFEKNIMIKDIKSAVSQGVDRIVIGALTDDDSIDAEYVEEMIRAACLINPNINITFHMAFDNIAVNKNYDSGDSIKKRVESIKILAELGVDTILTHGSNTNNPILENIGLFIAYIGEANKYGIDIMPGGGLSFLNLDKLIEELGTLEAVHGTKIVDIE